MEVLFGIVLGVVLDEAAKWAYAKYARARVEQLADDVRKDI